MRKTTKLYLSFGFIILLLLAGCAATRSGKNSIVGSWKYELKELPAGQNSGMMIISKKGEGFACHVKTDEGYELDFESFTVTDNKLVSYYYQEDGSRVDVTGTFSGNQFNGSAAAAGMTITVTATRTSVK
jgi:hypothetical protein